MEINKYIKYVKFWKKVCWIMAAVGALKMLLKAYFGYEGLF